LAYCTNADVVARLSGSGILYLVDEDNDGILDPAEDLLITAAINDASVEIDEALTPWFDNPSQCSGNPWLNVRCVDLACERLCGRKGQTPPETISARAQYARERLDLVRRSRNAQDGLRVPGLVYPGDTDTERNRVVGKPLITKPRR
jgi:phage gp36-like protein